MADTERNRRTGWLWFWLIVFVVAVLLVLLWAWPARRPAETGQEVSSVLATLLVADPLPFPGSVMVEPNGSAGS